MSVNDSLRALAERAKAAGRLALDTEFMGEGRYRTLLCLIQLAVPEEIGNPGHFPADRDPPIPSKRSWTARALAAVLADPGVRLSCTPAARTSR